MHSAGSPIAAALSLLGPVDMQQDTCDAAAAAGAGAADARVSPACCAVLHPGTAVLKHGSAVSGSETLAHVPWMVLKASVEAAMAGFCCEGAVASAKLAAAYMLVVVGSSGPVDV